MRFKKALFLLLLIYWVMTIAIFYLFDVSNFLDYESIIYLLILSASFVFFVNSSSRVALPFFLTVVIYTFFSYMIGAIKLGLLSEYGNDMWMFENYSWAKVKEINTWLRYGALSTLFLSAGVFSVDHRIGYKMRNKITDLDRRQMKIPYKFLFIALFLFLIQRIWSFSKFGYGAISGIEFDGIVNLYGVLNIESVLIISLIVLISQWQYLDKSNKILFISLLMFYTVFKIFTGARSFLFFSMIYSIIFVSYYKGNYLIGKKMVLSIVFLTLISIMLYPVALGFKNVTKYKAISGAPINISFLLNNVSLLDYGQSFFERKEGIVEIIDRLSVMGAALRIINDTSLVPTNEHITFIKIIKRTINDMVPGDVFNDQISSQQVFHETYFGRDVVYSGEEWGMYGIYYILFGYIGSLIALFITGIITYTLWVKIVLLKFSCRPILLAYILNSVLVFMYNPSIEIWFALTIFKPILTLLLIYSLLVVMKNIVKSVNSFLPKKKIVVEYQKGQEMICRF